MQATGTVLSGWFGGEPAADENDTIAALNTQIAMMSEAHEEDQKRMQALLAEMRHDMLMENGRTASLEEVISGLHEKLQDATKSTSGETFAANQITIETLKHQLCDERSEQRLTAIADSIAIDTIITSVSSLSDDLRAGSDQRWNRKLHEQVDSIATLREGFDIELGNTRQSLAIVSNLREASDRDLVNANHSLVIAATLREASNLDLANLRQSLAESQSVIAHEKLLSRAAQDQIDRVAMIVTSSMGRDITAGDPDALVNSLIAVADHLRQQRLTISEQGRAIERVNADIALAKDEIRAVHNAAEELLRLKEDGERALADQNKASAVVNELNRELRGSIDQIEVMMGATSGGAVDRIVQQRAEMIRLRAALERSAEELGGQQKELEIMRMMVASKTAVTAIVNTSAVGVQEGTVVPIMIAAAAEVPSEVAADKVNMVASITAMAGDSMEDVVQERNRLRLELETMEVALRVFGVPGETSKERLVNIASEMGKMRQAATASDMIIADRDGDITRVKADLAHRIKEATIAQATFDATIASLNSAANTLRSQMADLRSGIDADKMDRCRLDDVLARMKALIADDIRGDEAPLGCLARIIDERRQLQQSLLTMKMAGEARVRELEAEVQKTAAIVDSTSAHYRRQSQDFMSEMGMLRRQLDEARDANAASQALIAKVAAESAIERALLVTAIADLHAKLSELSPTAIGDIDEGVVGSVRRLISASGVIKAAINGYLNDINDIEGDLRNTKDILAAKNADLQKYRQLSDQLELERLRLEKIIIEVHTLLKTVPVAPADIASPSPPPSSSPSLTRKGSVRKRLSTTIARSAPDCDEIVMRARRVLDVVGELQKANEVVNAALVMANGDVARIQCQMELVCGEVVKRRERSLLAANAREEELRLTIGDLQGEIRALVVERDAIHGAAITADGTAELVKVEMDLENVKALLRNEEVQSARALRDEAALLAAANGEIAELRAAVDRLERELEMEVTTGASKVLMAEKEAAVAVVASVSEQVAKAEALEAKLRWEKSERVRLQKKMERVSGVSILADAEHRRDVELMIQLHDEKLSPKMKQDIAIEAAGRISRYLNQPPAIAPPPESEHDYDSIEAVVKREVAEALAARATSTRPSLSRSSSLSKSPSSSPSRTGSLSKTSRHQRSESSGSGNGDLIWHNTSRKYQLPSFDKIEDD